MMKKLLSCAVALAFFSGVASASSNLVVSTEGGQLEGFTKTVPGTQSKVETFLAVPFAAAPGRREPLEERPTGCSVERRQKSQ